MLQPQCLRCGAASKTPLCNKCLAFLTSQRPLLFEPRLLRMPSTVELLTKDKGLLLTLDPRKPLATFDDEGWEWKSEQGALSVLRHMGFDGGAPSALTLDDADVLHDILFRFSRKEEPDTREMATRLDALKRRVWAVPYLQKIPVSAESLFRTESVPTQQPQSGESPPVAAQPVTVAQVASVQKESDLAGVVRMLLPKPVEPEPSPVEPKPVEPRPPEPSKPPEIEVKPEIKPSLTQPPPPPPPAIDTPLPPKESVRRTPPPPEAMAVATELEQLEAEVQRLAMMKNRMEKERDEIQNMLQVERSALEEREILVTAQAATLQGRQSELTEREKDLNEKDAQIRRHQRRLDLIEFLNGVRKLDKKDIQSMCTKFQDLESLRSTSLEDLIALPHLGESKGREIYAALHPNWSEEDLSEKAHSLLESGDHHGALECYDFLIAKTPGSESLWFNKAEVLGMLGDREGALQAYSRVLEINKKNIVAWREKANLLFEMSRLEEGVRSLRNLIEIDRGQAETVIAKAEELVAKNNERDAVLLYNAVLETDAGNVKAYLGLGDCLLALGDYDMADKMYTRALGREPQNPTALYKKGAMLNRRGRWGAAIQLFNRAIALDWNYAAPWVGKGDILLKQGKPSEALDCFNKAIQFEPDSAEGWAGKALAHMARREPGEVEKAKAKALEIDPHNEAVKAMNNILKSGATPLKPRPRKVLIKEDTSEILKNVLRTSRTMSESQVARRLADIALDRGDLNEATKKYTEALELDSSDIDAWCGKGLVLRKLGRFKEAYDAYDHALMLNPGREDAKRGREACAKEVQRK